jgi:hypothetical protein
MLPTVLALGVVPVVAHLAIVVTAHTQGGSMLSIGGLVHIGFITASAVTHWAIYVGLLATFALTLRTGREPLITAMTRRLHGEISDELVVYTRRVTIAWSCFFAAQLATSATLFLFAPIVVWSFFVNVLDIPLVLMMFTAEYACRLYCLRDPPRHSLSAIFAMIRDIRASRSEAVGSC